MDLEIQGSLPGALTNSVYVDKIRVQTVNGHYQAKGLNSRNQIFKLPTFLLLVRTQNSKEEAEYV